MQMGKYKEPN